MKRLLLFFTLTWLCVSCNYIGSDVILYQAIDTTHMTHIKGEVVTSLQTSGCNELLDFGEHVLISAAIDRKLFHLITKDGVIVKSIGHIGKGHDEFLSVKNLQKIGLRSFMAYDNINNRISFYSVDSILNGSLSPYKKIYMNSPDVVNYAYELSEGNYMCVNGFVESKSIKRFAIMNSDGELKSSYNQYPGGKDSLLIAKAYNLQPPLIAFAPTKNKMIVANRPIGAIMEIFETQQNKISHIQTKYMIKPIVEVNSHNIIVNDREIIAGFTDLFISDQKIYATYIGAKTDQYPKTKIVQFNMDGEIEQVFKSEYLNSQIIFDEAKNIFYTLSLLPTGEVVLMKYDIDN